MIPDIRNKIDDCLGEESYSQRDVVYILVQAYKLLEMENNQAKFTTILFYRNWVCHAVLDRDRVRKIFEPVVAKYKDGFNDIASTDLASDEIRDAIKKEISPEILKAQLNEFIEKFLTPNLHNTNTLKWQNFREHLYEVIRDIPLRVMENDKEIFKLVCREVHGKINFDDLSIEVEMGDSSFVFEMSDRTL
ncbi:MAG: hypothetical protein AAB910_00260 [Patescibacteria group bacterium]